jgi:hypothetical protein
MGLGALVMTRFAQNSRRTIVAFNLLTALALAGGCSQSISEDLGLARDDSWSQVQLPNTPREAGFDAAIYAAKQWFRIEDTSPGQGVIRTVATEYNQKGGTGRIRDTAIQYQNRMRHTATIVVSPRGGGCVAKCVVRVERLDTSDHRVFQDNQKFTDYPTATPIDREASLSASQDQAWTPMPRDRALEMQILDVIRSKVGGAQSAATSSPA